MAASLKKRKRQQEKRCHNYGGSSTNCVAAYGVSHLTSIMAAQQVTCQRQEEEEVCCWRFEPVVVLGREGVIVLTGKRLLFAAHKNTNNSSSSSGNDSDGNSSTWEVLLQFPLAAWTSTERSKKAAKVCFSASAAGAIVADCAIVAAGAATERFSVGASVAGQLQRRHLQ